MIYSSVFLLTNIHFRWVRSLLSTQLEEGAQILLFGNVLVRYESSTLVVDKWVGRTTKYTFAIGVARLYVRVPDDTLDPVCECIVETNAEDHPYELADLVGDFLGQPPETPEEWSLVSKGHADNKTQWIRLMMVQNAKAFLRGTIRNLMDKPMLRPNAALWTPSHVD